MVIAEVVVVVIVVIAEVVVVAEVIVVGLLAAQTICHMKCMVLIDLKEL